MGYITRLRSLNANRAQITISWHLFMKGDVVRLDGRCYSGRNGAEAGPVRQGYLCLVYTLPVTDIPFRSARNDRLEPRYSTPINFPDNNASLIVVSETEVYKRTGHTFGSAQLVQSFPLPQGRVGIVLWYPYSIINRICPHLLPLPARHHFLVSLSVTSWTSRPCTHFPNLHPQTPTLFIRIPANRYPTSPISA